MSAASSWECRRARPEGSPGASAYVGDGTASSRPPAFELDLTALNAAEREIEGPAFSGDFTACGFWTSDGREFHAFYVIARNGNFEPELKRDFQPFAH